MAGASGCRGASLGELQRAGRPSQWSPWVCGAVVAVGVLILTSLMLISASTYCSPFWRMEMSAAGGTSVPLMLD